jgi:hypothetical protein
MYWLYKFGDYELPRAGTNPENFQIGFKSPELDIHDGSVDLYGNTRTGLNANSLSTNGVIDSLASLKSLRRLIGTKANIIRERDSDAGLEYTPARLTKVEIKRISRFCETVEVDLEFRLYRPIWYYETANTDERTLTGPTTNFSLDNTNSEYELGGIITLEVSGSVTNPKFQVGDRWVQYTGVLGASDVLVIDNDGKTITVNDVDAFDDLTSSNLSEWVLLEPGVSNSVSVTCTITGTADLTWEWETAVL